MLIEPLYDSYLPYRAPGGSGLRGRSVSNRPTGRCRSDELRAAFSEKTKLILFNTPMNPCAKVFTRGELDLIAALCIEHDAYAVCDEVYEHLAFDGKPHIPMITHCPACASVRSGSLRPARSSP